jgi:hypothetical protein
MNILAATALAHGINVQAVLFAAGLIGGIILAARMLAGLLGGRRS